MHKFNIFTPEHGSVPIDWFTDKRKAHRTAKRWRREHQQRHGGEFITRRFGRRVTYRLAINGYTIFSAVVTEDAE